MIQILNIARPGIEYMYVEGILVHHHVFSAVFLKGNNFYDFMFISLDNKTLPNVGGMVMSGSGFRAGASYRFRYSMARLLCLQ